MKSRREKCQTHVLLVAFVKDSLAVGNGKKSKIHFCSLKPNLNQKIYIFEMLHFSTV